MLINKIDLHKHLRLKSLSTRTLAKRIVDYVNNNVNEYFVILSFSNIEFASRSFFNEINYLRKNETKKKIFFINLRKDLKSMENLSNNNKKDINSEREISTITIDSIINSPETV